MVSSKVLVVVLTWLLGGGGRGEESASCSLCFDGSPSPFPDRDVNPAFEGKIPNRVKTCREVEQYLASKNTPEDSKKCASIRENGALACGCPAVPFDKESSSCSLCFGGAEPAEELLDFTVNLGFLVVPNTTCRELFALASLPSQTGIRCDDLRWTGYKNCGCPRPSGDPLCQLGCDIPESKWKETVVQLPWQTRWNAVNDDWTCGDVDAFTRMTASVKGCGLLASAANAGCGCPAPLRQFGEEFACPLCPGDENLMPLGSTLNKRASASLTCFNLLYYEDFIEEDRCPFIQGAAEGHCCNPICKDDPGASLYVVLRDKGQFTNCEELRNSLGGSFDERYAYCDSKAKIRKHCKRTCRRCRKAECGDDDSVTLPKMTVSLFTDYCERLGRKKGKKKIKKIAQICKDNPEVRKACSKTCFPDFCDA